MITVDHGRGDVVKSNWKHHGTNVSDSHEIWMAVIGPDTKPAGEVKKSMQLYQGQAATTMAALLGFDFKPAHIVKEPIKAMYQQ